VALLLQADPTLTVVGGARSGQAALQAVATLKPDVVLLDLRLPDMPAPEVVTGLRSAWPDAKVVVFTAHGDHDEVRAALAAGAVGCLLKDAATIDLVRALHGELPSATMARTGLTRREYEVLRLAAQGCTNPEIAETLGLTRNTVKTYLQSAMQKIGARNRVDAISKASEAGLL
jgi:DNA-binding NarL/FixJ family response regulator